MKIKEIKELETEEYERNPLVFWYQTMENRIYISILVSLIFKCASEKNMKHCETEHVA